MKFIEISKADTLPVPKELSPKELKALHALYKEQRSKADLEDEYRDFERQVAEGIPFEELLKNWEKGVRRGP